MWNAVSITDDVEADQPFTLSGDVSAIELIRIENGDAGLGPVLKIPEGAEIHFCGEGFNDQTLKVRWEDQFYFVFLQDLQAQRKPMAQAVCN